ncbi:MAG: penicillin-binding transpeptidase domain-containing protein [Oscillospiraceae bacterium]|nr:penicillin-binding transpeptidase domain-containing protein [Oscillospiraceae bacterium]
MKSVVQNIMAGVAAFLVVAGVAAGGIRLMKIQLVESTVYEENNVLRSDAAQTIKSSRGEIVDSEGKAIIGNKVGYNVIIQPDSFPTDNKEGNEVILKIVSLLKDNDIALNLSIPISETTPYKFTTDDDDTLKKFKSKIGVNVYATAQNCIDAIKSDYDVLDSYTEEEQRTIVGVRYEMLRRDFSMATEFVLAEDIDKKLVADIEELSIKYPGIDIVESAIREVKDGDIIPHEIGTVGPIYAEEYEELKNKGYSLDDIVGKSGIEKAMDMELRGVDGVKTINMEDGKVVDTEITQPVENGHTVQLTVDGKFQKGLQSILDNFVDNFGSLKNQKTAALEAQGGAIAVLDCESGAVLGLATNPTYNLQDYKEDYESILNADNTPLVNRATTGLYRPGSTFKVITATAGLNEGLVNANTTFNCTKNYEYMDQMYHCTGHHGDISIARALMVSCNIYFYHLSELLTIDKISDYAKMFGLAQHTGIETNDAVGRIGDQATYAALGQMWTVGQVLQTGIGNSETAITPLQMANVALTVANKGVRYQPYLIDSIWDYEHEKCISKTQKTVSETIETKFDNTWDIVKEGMILASTNNMPQQYSLSNLGYDVAIKTGTPQLSSRTQDSLFIGFAPADNPKIAFCGVVEGGEYSKYMIRSILRLYEKVYGNFEGSTYDPNETVAASTESTATSDQQTQQAFADEPQNNNADENNNNQDNYENQQGQDNAGVDDYGDVGNPDA